MRSRSFATLSAQTCHALNPPGLACSKTSLSAPEAGIAPIASSRTGKPRRRGPIGPPLIDRIEVNEPVSSSPQSPMAWSQFSMVRSGDSSIPRSEDRVKRAGAI